MIVNLSYSFSLLPLTYNNFYKELDKIYCNKDEKDSINHLCSFCKETGRHPKFKNNFVKIVMKTQCGCASRDAHDMAAAMDYLLECADDVGIDLRTPTIVEVEAAEVVPVPIEFIDLTNEADVSNTYVESVFGDMSTMCDLESIHEYELELDFASPLSSMTRQERSDAFIGYF